MGTVVEVGMAVKDIKVCDRVVSAFDIACGACFLCKKVRPAGLTACTCGIRDAQT